MVFKDILVIILVVLVFTGADFLLHGIKVLEFGVDRDDLSDGNYFRNKIIFGIIIGIVTLLIIMFFVPMLIPMKYLIISISIAVLLQLRYITGFPIDFVVAYGIIHFVIVYGLFFIGERFRLLEL